MPVTLAKVQAKLNKAQNTNVCFVLGEVAKNQDNNSCGDLDLRYNNKLNYSNW